MKVVRNLLCSVSTLGLLGCLAPPVESPNVTVVQETPVRVAQNVKDKVDILFLVDNSLSMKPKQDELKARFPQLIKVLTDFGQKGNPADYHIAVINSDVGAGTLNQSGCKPNGDNGAMKAIGKAAPGTCAALADGAQYIKFNQKDGSNNIGSRTLEDAFSCMAAVGDQGCGFEHSLEAVYRALHDTPAGNEGFLREDALLAVVFVTDEDDCSAPPNSDLFDPSKTAAYGELQSFRCVRFGYTCDGAQPPYGASGGALANCTPSTEAAGGKLIDVAKYTNYFTQPRGKGGVKIDPNDVILVSISAAPTPVQVLLAKPNTTPGPYMECGGPVGPMCQVVVQHSCTAPDNPAFFGDPAVRISAVVSAAKNNQITSICDTDYTAALQKMGELIVSQIGAGCLNSPIASPTMPDCNVENITTLTNGDTQITNIPACSSPNFTAPATSSNPCWKLDDKLAQYKSEGCLPADQTSPASCKLPPSCQPVNNPANNDQQELYGVTIDYGVGGTPPPATIARVACATIATGGN